MADTIGVENADIASTLDAYAALLDLAGARNWSVRAYRRAAELVRDTPAPVAELVRTGRVRELRGIGPGIERRLRELVETGRIAELEELEREVEPELVALRRFLGLGPQRLVAVGRALGIRSAAELREAAEAGRLRDVPGIGPAREARILAGLARREWPQRRGLRFAWPSGRAFRSSATRTPTRLSNMRLAVTTARRGGATAADVLNTRPLAEILRG